MTSLSVKAVTNRHGHVVTLEETGKGHIKVWGNGVTLSRDEAIQLRDWLNAQYPTPPAAAHGDEAVPANLKARCQEISQWRKTGVLQGDALREYAESRWPGDHSALQMAEHETASEAFQIVAAMRAQGDGGNDDA